jgi:hypothetical protein
MPINREAFRKSHPQEDARLNGIMHELRVETKTYLQEAHDKAKNAPPFARRMTIVAKNRRQTANCVANGKLEKAIRLTEDYLEISTPDHRRRLDTDKPMQGGVLYRNQTRIEFFEKCLKLK